MPEYKVLNLEYAFRNDDDEKGFGSEEEMLEYFVNTNDIAQTFYWNQYVDNPDKILFGVDITDDNKTIFSLTVNGTIALAEAYLNDLKQKLNSDIGIMTFYNPAEYENGLDFKTKYQY